MQKTVILASFLLATNTLAVEVVKVTDLATEEIKIPNLGDLRGLHITDEKVIWISGSGGLGATSSDGGANWENFRITPEDLDIRGIHGFSAKEACALSAGESELGKAKIFLTQDGGLNWVPTLEIKQPGIFLDSIAFWDASNGIVLGDPKDGEFVLYKTEDGCKTWKKLNPVAKPLNNPGEGAFAASNSCLAVQGNNEVWFATGGSAGNTARVFFSQDAGLNWRSYDTRFKTAVGTAGIFSLVIQNGIGIAVGGDFKSPSTTSESHALLSQDGGETWQPVGYSLPYLSSAAWANSSLVVVVDGSNTTLPLNTVRVLKGTGWAVGPKGKVVRFSY